jgi:hypothetical protein
MTIRYGFTGLILLAGFAAALAVANFGVRAQNNQAVALTNNRASISIAANGVWSANWPNASIKDAAFNAELNGASPSFKSETGKPQAFTDALGSGQEVRQTLRAASIRIEREWRLYDNGSLTIGGRLVNESSEAVQLGNAQLMQGGWQLGQMAEAPAAVVMRNSSQTSVIPFAAANQSAEQDYVSPGLIAFYNRADRAAMLVAYVRADEASPDLAAKFTRANKGVSLSATSRYLNRMLEAKQTLELNRLYVATGESPYNLLESYGTAMAQAAALPARTGPTALWCSWYAHRMEVSEEKVLANAEIAARHFKPLGFEIMQVDHGWQRGDITGDWTVNERFPHGLRWLSDQLRRRYGLKLGLWISPTDIADTSELYRQHPDWVLHDDEGKPKVNWKWYWKPNPNCYQLDTSRAEVRDHIAQTFKQLTSEGVSYFKIDFIGSLNKEVFAPRNAEVTRGWPVLRRAMQAVRDGAGDAWVRYCQAPPLLSAGLADGSYGGDDTADAGQPGLFRVLRDNARILATSFWVNDRAYHREVCDMSMRMQADIEEVRVRAAIMTLANASISWSDELTYLPPSRIRMMQQCMPPGNPQMQPVDLFDRDIPSVWHIRAKNEADNWDVVGLFNFNEQTESREVRFADLGLDAKAEYAVFEFWEEKFLGVVKQGIELQLPAQSSRILSIRRLTGKPQLIGTDMHVLQGYHELKQLAWDESQTTLSGRFQRMPGLHSKAFFLVPTGFTPKFEFPLSPNSARLTHVAGNVWMQEIEFAARDYDWKIPFERVKPPTVKEPN